MLKKKSKTQPGLISDFKPIAKTDKKKRPRFRLKNISKKYFISITAIVLVAGGGVFWYFSNHKTTNSADLNTVMSNVSALMLLPTNETPSLATVTDKKSLKDKFLSDHAENGDRILIYSENKMLIIYRPGINKIAAVGTITVDPALSEAKNTSITIYNGSDNTEKVQKIANDVKIAYPDLNVTIGGSTNRHDFPTTIVIDNTNQKDYLVDGLVQAINGKRGVMPLGETKASTDLTIIVGKD